MTPQPILLNDYTLAAFMAGTLPQQQRKSVAASLLLNQDAREWLHMAAEAMTASREEGNERVMRHRSMAARIPARPRHAQPDRPAKPVALRAPIFMG